MKSLLTTLLLCTFGVPALGADVGLLFRDDCTAVAAPVTGKTVCFDQTARVFKVWGGSSWSAIDSSTPLNVKWFGAAGDGITDDTTAIQAAATAAIGKTLLFPPGMTFLISTVNIGAGATVLMDGATIKQKVLTALTGSPIFNITGANVTFRGGTFDGQRASQPADGFADAYNTGPNATGRAYRAGIKADATVNPGITNLRVEGVTFGGLYGAGVATLDVPSVTVTRCIISNSNFELAVLYQSVATLTDAWVTDNLITDLGSGHPSVNANGIVIRGYHRVTVRGNHGHNIERTLVKIENGSSISITDNILDTNTKDNFPGIQVALYGTSDRILIKGNILYNVQKGIQVAQSARGGTSNGVIISNNEVHTTTGTDTPDGIGVVLHNGKNVVIQGNTLLDIKRNGTYVGGQISQLIIDGNVAYGQASSGTSGIALIADTGNWGSVKVTNNHMENFDQSAVGIGMLSLQRVSTNTFALLTIHGNTVLAGGSANRGIYAAGVDLILGGSVAENYVDGRIELNTNKVETRNNTQNGSGAGNVAIVGKTQTTVGAPGGASALPATPTGYAIINKDGTEYLVPYFAK